jgi:hypothetical protein
MFDILDLLWRFFASQPLSRYLQLHPWHLQTILMVLGLLAAGGLHHLIGFTFRFYRVHTDYAHWLGMPTLVLLLFSVQMLLACYTLVTQAEALVRQNLNTEETIQPAGILGEHLLAPAFTTPELARSADAGVSKERLAAALRALPADEYRNRLRASIVDPDRITVGREGMSGASKSGENLVPRSETAPSKAGAGAGPAAAPAEPPSIVLTSRAELATAVLVQMALRWLVDPNRAWPQLAVKPESQSAAAEPALLPEFIVSLVGEIQEGVVLERLDWEHVAGHRFSSAVMQPTLVRYVTRTAIVGAALLLVLNAFYFFGFYRLRRWMKRKRQAAAAKTQAGGAGDAVQSPPH